MIMQKASKAQLRRVRELLRDKETRDKEGLFVAEGLKIIKDMIAKGHTPESVIVSASNEDFMREIQGKSFPVFQAICESSELGHHLLGRISFFDISILFHGSYSSL